MAAKEVRVGDVGSVIGGTVRDQDGAVYDLSSYSSLYLYLTRPDDTVEAVTPTLPNGGSDGLVRYVWASGDLDQDGLWRAQIECTVGGQTLKSDIKTFRVHPNLQ